MSKERLISLDAFRGLTVGAMVLVNNPASWSFVYAPLRHAPWHGWTPTDLIFPFFLFIVGMSMALSFARRVEEGRAGSALMAKIFKRSVLIFALGLFLHLFPKFRFATMRIPGVLQRIAVCFLIGALLYLKFKPRARIVLSIFILVLYWALLTMVPVPGFGPGVLDEKGNLCGYVDSLIMRGHLYKPDFDPEGPLSTLPAIVTVLLGSLAGDGLRTRHTNNRKMVLMTSVGILLTLGGLILGRWFPINKQLWTSSYVVFTAGLALLVFAFLFAALEGPRWKAWSWPFLVLGTNAIVVFAGSAIMVKSLLLIKIADAGKTVSPITWLYNHALAPLAGPTLGSLLYPILLIILWVLIIWPLYKHKVFIKL
jgi:predicted acyltransferase